MRGYLILTWLAVYQAQLLAAPPPSPPPLPAAGLSENDPKLAEKLIERIDQLFRADSSFAEVSMEIETPHWKRTMRMNMWSLGKEKSFVRILYSKKDKGISTLRVKKEMWNYFPKAKRVIKVPPSMMMASWMGSDFTNDDMVRETSLLDDYNASAVIDQKKAHYKITLTAKSDTASLWQTITIYVNKNNLMPIKQQYYDEKAQLIRTMQFSDVKSVSGRLIPTRMELIPQNKKGHKTTVIYQKATFNQKVQDSIFTQQNLRRKVL